MMRPPKIRCESPAAVQKKMELEHSDAPISVASSSSSRFGFPNRGFGFYWQLNLFALPLLTLNETFLLVFLSTFPSQSFLAWGITRLTNRSSISPKIE